MKDFQRVALFLIFVSLYFFIFTTNNLEVLIILCLLMLSITFFINLKSIIFFLSFSILFFINFYITKNIIGYSMGSPIIFLKFILLVLIGYLSFYCIKRDKYFNGIYNKVLIKFPLLGLIHNSLPEVRRSILMKNKWCKCNFAEKITSIFYDSLKCFLKHSH